MGKKLWTVIRGVPIWVRVAFVLLLVLSGLLVFPAAVGNVERIRLATFVMIAMGLLIGYQLRRQLALPGVRVIPDYVSPHLAVAFLGLLLGMAVVLVTGTWLYPGGLFLWLGAIGLLALLAGENFSGVVPLLLLSQYFAITRSSWISQAMMARIQNPSAPDMLFGLVLNAGLVFLLLRESQSIREKGSAQPRYPSDRAASVLALFTGPDTRTFHRYSGIKDAGFIAQALHLRRSFQSGTLLVWVIAFGGILWWSRETETLFGILTLSCAIVGIQDYGWLVWLSALPFSRRSLVLRYGAAMTLETLKVILGFVIALFVMSQLRIRAFPAASQLISAIALQLPLLGLKALFLLATRNWTRQQVFTGISVVVGLLFLMVTALTEVSVRFALPAYAVLGALLTVVAYVSWRRADLT